jgi:hypothetical protein
MLVSFWRQWWSGAVSKTAPAPQRRCGRPGGVRGPRAKRCGPAVEPLEVRRVLSTVWFVNEAANGAGAGLSWTDAFTELPAALRSARNGDQVWVARGTYEPTLGTDRTSSFALPDGVAIYGGFAGTEATLAQRDWKANVTTLSGDIGAPRNASDNSYHVVIASGLTAPTTLDGFTVRAGNADATESKDQRGGGLWVVDSASWLTLARLVVRDNVAGAGAGLCLDNSSPTLTDVAFVRNASSILGGGLAAFQASPTMNGVRFQGNSAAYHGGGLFNLESSPTMRSVAFVGNVAKYGGAVYNNSTSRPTLTDVEFRGNRATQAGGGMFVFLSAPTLTDVRFRDNKALYGGGMSIEAGAPKLTRVTFSHNVAERAGGAIENYLGSPQLFGVTYRGNWAKKGRNVVHENAWPRARAELPAPTASPPSDADGDAAARVWHVDGSAPAGRDGRSWVGAFKDLQTALVAARPGDQVWVARGTYTPTTGTDRSASFALPDGVAIYGGFAGTETALGQRDWVANVTTLSGEIGVRNTQADNSYHVVTAHGLTAATTLSGFTIIGGNADGPTAADKRGGGMWVTASAGALTVTHVTFRNNRAYNGGAMYLATPTATLREVGFVGNSAALVAGGLFCDTSAPTLTHVSFIGNAARYGGALYTNAGSTPHVSGGLFRENRATRDGGGLSAFLSGPAFSDVVFVGNAADFGGGMSLDLASPQLNRVTFAGNSASRGGGIQSYLGTRPFQAVTYWRNHAGQGPNIFVIGRP